MATHYVHKLGLYWEEWESYRDERGRPRKRFIKYWGRRDPRRRWGGVGPVRPINWDKIEQAQLVEVKQEENAHQMFRTLQGIVFKEETGLDLPHGVSDPVPIEKPVSKIDYSTSLEPSHAEPAPRSEPEPSAPEVSQSEQPSEPDADADLSSVC